MPYKELTRQQSGLIFRTTGNSPTRGPRGRSPSLPPPTMTTLECDLILFFFPCWVLRVPKTLHALSLGGNAVSRAPSHSARSWSTCTLRRTPLRRRIRMQRGYRHHAGRVAQLSKRLPTYLDS